MMLNRMNADFIECCDSCSYYGKIGIFIKCAYHNHVSVYDGSATYTFDGRPSCERCYDALTQIMNLQRQSPDVWFLPPSFNTSFTTVI